MSEESSLISIVQQQIADTTPSSGKYFKIFGAIEKDFTVSHQSFESFIIDILALLQTSNGKYFSDRYNAVQNQTVFNPATYGLPLCEKITEHVSQVRVNINFSFSDRGSDELLGEFFIYKCVKALQDIILGLFFISHQDSQEFCKELFCFVLQSDTWIVGDNRFMKLSFVFPYAKVNTEHLNRGVLYYFRKNLIDNDIIKDDLLKMPIGDIENYIPDTGIYIPLYGCKENKLEPPCLLRGVYSSIEDPEMYSNITDEKMLPFYVDFMNSPIINPYESSLILNRYVDRSALELFESKIDLLPLILSNSFTNSILRLNSGVDLNLTPETKKVEIKTESFVNCVYDKFSKLAELIPMLAPSRTIEENKYYWMDIGKALHNIYSGTEYGLTTFQNITTDQSLKMDCEEVYYKFQAEILDIRTIEEFAKQDSPEQYKMWKRHQYWEKIPEMLSLASMNVAEPIAEYFSLEFVYDRLNGEWFHFVNNRLKRDIGALELIKAIREHFIQVFYAYRDELTNKSMAEQTKAGKKYYEDLIKEVGKGILKFSDLSFLQSVVRACTVFMFDDHLYVKTDENLHLTGCTNGVIECFDDTITFRKGKLQDYITKSTNIPFPTHMTEDDVRVKFMRKYYSQVFTDQHLCHYFMKWSSSILKGGNDEKFFMNWIGDPNASKSQMLKFFQIALGEYCVAFPNHLITININSNSGRPEPALEKAKGAKLVFASETDASEQLHVGHIKGFTGNDTYTCRTLNKEGGERTLTFKLIHISNVICSVPGADEGYKIREVIIPYTSRWVDNAPADVNEQYRQRVFPIDLDFSNKIRFFANAHLWLMFMNYPLYRKEKIRVLPRIVKEITNQHHLDIDVMYNFVKDRLQLNWIGDPKDKVINRSVTSNAEDLFNIYKRWFRICYGNKVESLNFIEFRNEMVKRLGQQENGYWYGVCPRQEGGGSGSI